jgi:hypothetical protein
MATYEPPQPMWKRNLAGILDFFLAFFVYVYVVSPFRVKNRPQAANVRCPLLPQRTKPLAR